MGWIAHYLIGVTFAGAFVGAAGARWLQHPTPLPAILFGVLTASAPFFIMQPALGLGVAASKTANPMRTRFRTDYSRCVWNWPVSQRNADAAVALGRFTAGHTRARWSVDRRRRMREEDTAHGRCL